MSNFDTELRDRLTTLADRMPMAAADVTDDVKRRARNRRVNRLALIGVAAIAVVTAAIVVPLTVHGQSRVGRVVGKGAGAIDIGGATRSQLPKPAALQRELEVGTPSLTAPETGASFSEPLCAASSLHASAHSATTAEGVVGAVTVTGRGCELGTKPRVTGFLAGKTPIDLQTSTGDDTTNLPFPTYYEPRTPVTVGFAWRGSWCDAAATALRINLGSGRDHNKHGREVGPVRHLGMLIVPMSGPSPACHGGSHSVLVPGLVGNLHQPVQTAPDSWSGLRLTLRVGRSGSGHLITGIVATVHNITADPIELNPCPSYAMTIQSHVGGLIGAKHSGGGSELDGKDGPFGCGSARSVVPADGELEVPLPNVHFAYRHVIHPGTVITIQLGIAGVPTATTHVRVML